nr:GH92 family glycosyl hydrolase [Ulvibacterium sp.]
MYRPFSFLSFFYLVILLLLLALSCGEMKEDPPVPNLEYTSFVDPFIGTKGNALKRSFGNVHPGAVVPWGMTAISPQTFDFTKAHLATGYRYGEEKIYGFSCVNFSGVGCPAAGHVPFKFSSRPFSEEPLGSTYSEEVAKPGYYSVRLNEEDIRVKATTTTRSGLFQIELPAGSSTVYLDLNAQQGHVKGGHIATYDYSSVSGHQVEGFFCGSNNRSQLYFHVEMDRKADSLFLVHQNKTTHFEKYLEGEPSGIVYQFENEKPTDLHIKVGVSFVSERNARENLHTEQSGFNFETVRGKAKIEWERELGKIQVETTSRDDMVKFYTALYHSLLMPITFSDHNGEYIQMDSKEVGQAEGYTRYTGFSLWDTYRTTHPLFTLVYPERQLDMVKTMVGIYKESGWLPKWEIFAYEPNIMVGDPAAIVLGDTYVKGIDRFDVGKAYEAVTKQATVIEGNRFRRGLKEYLDLGYIPMDSEVNDAKNFGWNNGIVWGAVSTSMEFNLADYNIAQMANLLGKKQDFQYYLNRSMSFLKLYDDETGLLRPKNRDGSWYRPFDPAQDLWDDMNFGLRGGPGFVEGSAWQYLFSIPHGLDSLKTRLGDERFLSQLNTIFEDKHFDMTNEPGLGFPFFYNYTREKAYSTAQKINELLATHFTTQPNGLPGNDDAGTMSAWVVFAMLGIYPDTPGNPSYMVTLPSFEKVVLKLNTDFYQGKEFTIKRLGTKGRRIKSMRLDDKAVDYRINHFDITGSTSELIIETE